LIWKEAKVHILEWDKTTSFTVTTQVINFSFVGLDTKEKINHTSPSNWINTMVGFFLGYEEM